MSKSVDEVAAGLLRAVAKAPPGSPEMAAAQRKAGLVGEQFRDATLGAEMRRMMDRLVALMRPSNSAEEDGPKLVEELTRRGWRQASEAVYGCVLPSLGNLELRQRALLAPTARALAGLVKTVPAAKKELVAIAAGNPAAMESAIADWLFQSGPPAKAAPLLGALLRSGTRAAGLADPEALLQSCLQRDKKSNLVVHAVMHLADDPAALHQFGRALLRNPKTARQSAAALTAPKLLKSHERGVIALIQAVAAAALSEARQTATFRRTASLLFIRLISDALLVHGADKPQPMWVHKARIALDDLERAADSPGVREQTWNAHPLNQAEPGAPSAAKIEVDGAKMLKIAFDNIEPGVDALALLEGLAFNLGLAPQSAPGERLRYQPLLHEDTVGGMHPGDEAEVVRKGWSLGDTTVIRTRVKPA